MGNKTVSVCSEVFRECSVNIAQATENYLDFLQDTTALVQVDLSDLIKSLDQIVEDFKNFKNSANLGTEGDLYELSLNRHSNYQKHSIRRMFEHLQIAHDYFIKIFSVIEEDDDINPSFTENKLMYDARAFSEIAVKAFEEDLNSDSKFPKQILIHRSMRYRRLLFRDIDQLLRDIVARTIANRKMIILSYVDETLRFVLKSKKAILAPAQMKVIIDEIIDFVNEEIVALSHLPISNTVLLETACEDVQLHVRTTIRGIQLAYYASINKGDSLNNLLDQVLLENRIDTNLDLLALSEENSEVYESNGFGTADNVLSRRQCATVSSPLFGTITIKKKRKSMDIAPTTGSDEATDCGLEAFDNASDSVVKRTRKRVESSKSSQSSKLA